MSDRNLNQKTLFFVGDSHSLAIWGAGERVATLTGSNLFVYGYAETPFPVLSYSSLSTQNDGRKQFRELESFLRSSGVVNRGDVVFLTMILPSYFSSESKVVARRGSGLIPIEELRGMWLTRVLEFADFLESKGASLVLFSPTPIFDGDFGRCAEQWYVRLNSSGCRYPRSKYVAEYSDVLISLHRLEEMRKNIHVFDLLGLVCRGGICSFNSGGLPMYRDGNHLNDHAARSIVAPSLLEFLKNRGLI
jgi:hypothetical protein